MADEIDVGPGATDRASSQAFGGTTRIQKNNAANLAGTIDTIEIWAKTDVGSCYVGIFYLVSGTTYKCRARAQLGAVTAGAKRTYTVDSSSNPIAMDVVAGDYIGVYISGGSLEAETGDAGQNASYTGNSCVVDSEYEYSETSTYIHSVYGIGDTPAAAGNIVKMMIEAT